MHPIGSIIWPEDGVKAVDLYLSFLVQVIETLGIQFSGDLGDPVSLVKSFISGKASDFDRTRLLDSWWGYIDNKEAIRNFHEHDVVMARLAICLLSVPKCNGTELGENLSWFFEVLGFLGVDLSKAIQMMQTYFEFR